MAATMGTMQVLVYEYRNADHLGRGYAKNQLTLHLLALQHLRKTYWSAELQGVLFKTCMAVVERDLGIADEPLAPRPDSRSGDMGPPTQAPVRAEPSELDRADFENFPAIDLHEYWEVFKPFLDMPLYGDDLG